MDSVTTTPRIQERFGKLSVHTITLVLCFLTIFPFIWMATTSFKPATEVFTQGWGLIIENPTLKNFPDAFNFFPVQQWLTNSFGISVLTTIGKILISVPAAYAFSRLQFRGRNVAFAAVLATMIVPGVVTIVPNYVMVSRLGWMDSWAGVIIPSLPATAFYVFLLRQNMMTLPQDLVDAGRVDGASSIRILIDIIIPNIKPAIAVVTILSFLGAWNQYLWPLLIVLSFFKFVVEDQGLRH